MIVQFSHNGGQLDISNKSRRNGIAFQFDKGSKMSGVRFWNDEPQHKRKFIRHQGWYLENIENKSFNPNPKQDELFFWGEWEPQSRFQLTGNSFSAKSLPHAIHSPFLSLKGIGGHNTDPFVFGDHFYYTNCKQRLSGRGSIMLSLTTGSIILFGSEISKTHFVLDTFFVVESSESVSSYRIHPTDYPDILRRATIDLNGGLELWKKLYQGKMYDFKNQYEKEKPYTFCLFPCKAGSTGLGGFARPIIDVKKFGLQKVGAGTVLMSVNYSSDINFWHDIVTELLVQGYSLGIKLEMPKVNDDIELPESDKPKSTCDNKQRC